VLSLEIGRQGKFAGEKAGSRGDRVFGCRGDDEPTALLDQLDLAVRFEPECAAKLPRNQNVALFRNMGDTHGKVLHCEIRIA